MPVIILILGVWIASCTMAPQIEPVCTDTHFQPVGNCRTDTLVTDWKLSSEEWAIFKLINLEGNHHPSYFTASDLYIQTCIDTLYFKNTAIIRKQIKYVGGFH